MNNVFLEELFYKINKTNLKYCVLRGYEGLPEVVKNDIDFGVAPENKIEFFSILKSLSLKHNYTIKIELIRFCVIKMGLNSESGAVLKIDVWWGFNIAGLQYMDITDLVNSRKLYRNRFFIPSKEYEFALSFLKEMLHNNWIRKDKIDNLKSLVTENYHIAFKKFFNKNEVDEFILAVRKNKYEISKLSHKSKFKLIFYNIKYITLIVAFKNIYLFLKFKYFYKDEYDYLI
tara:strand:- start:1059 stop:1751 length:693 start_codon:yes stop_codon:yes gene_type:complete